MISQSRIESEVRVGQSVAITKLLVVPIADARIDYDFSLVMPDEKGSQGLADSVLGVRGVLSPPQQARDDAKHGSAIQVEVAGIYGCYI